MMRLLLLIWGSPRRAAVTSTVTVFVLFVGWQLIPVVRDAAGWLLVASPLTLLIASFPNESKQAVGRFLGLLARASTRLELEAVRQDVEGTLGIGTSELQRTCPQATMLPFRIDYIRSGAEVDRLPDGTLVVGMAQHGNRTRNLVSAAWAYARHGVIPDARPYLDADVSQALDLVVAKAILAPAGRAALTEFLQRIWSPAVIGQDRLRALVDKLDRLQEDALLGPIILSEFLDLSVSLGVRFPSDAVALESAEFVEYLHGLAVREPGERVGDSANFDGQAIRSRVIFVARPEIYEVKGPGPYRGAVEWALKRAYHRVYLLAASRRNVDYLREIIEPYRSDPSIREVQQFTGLRQAKTGRLVDQLIIRLIVNVRYIVGIGQRPRVAVGPAEMLAGGVNFRS